VKILSALPTLRGLSVEREQRHNMKNWPVQDAKARFSELLDICLREGPQLVTRRGTEAAVLVPMREWQRLRDAAGPSLKELLLAEDARAEIPVPPRGLLHRRTPRGVA
jgi:antitoxin Phd